jgi:hypothetical protein
MNQSIHFTTRVHQGQIAIPTEFMNVVEDNLEIEVIIKPKQSQQKPSRLMDRLAQNPLIATGWRELSKDTIHTRDDD